MNYAVHLRDWLDEYKSHAYVHGTFAADIAFDIFPATLGFVQTRRFPF